jgi:hypothetical protein
MTRQIVRHARLPTGVAILTLLAALAPQAIAQSARIPDPYAGFGQTNTVKQLTCQGKTIQFARGLRWTPPDYGVQLSVFPAGKPGGEGPVVELPASCYTEMSCVTYDGKPSMLLVRAPACGGNAVGEDYLVFNLANLRHRVLNYQQASRAGLLGR